jgi:hypothetical protein
MARLKSAVLVAVVLASGCKSVRSGADLGHRVLDQPGLPASKFLGMIGATAGGLVAAPITVLFLPTYMFPKLGYRSAPDHDLWMPIVFAPAELSMGLGALVTSCLALPFQRIRPEEDGGLPQVVLHAVEPAAASGAAPAPAPPAPPPPAQPAGAPEKR